MSTKLAVVSYHYPNASSNYIDGYWERVIAVRPSFVIANPSSGPGLVRDPNYATLMLRLIEARIPTIGYLATDYAQKPLWVVENERRYYRGLYPPLSGYFFDEVAPEADRVSYHKALCRDGDFNILNPGRFPHPDYARTGAILCPFETDYETYLARQQPDWLKHYGQTFHIVHSIPDVETMRKVVVVAQSRNCGYLWACSDPAEYNALPEWFDELSKMLQ